MIEQLNRVLVQCTRWGLWKCHDRRRNLDCRFTREVAHRVYFQMKLYVARRAYYRRVTRGEARNIFRSIIQMVDSETLCASLLGVECPIKQAAYTVPPTHALLI